MSTEKEEGKEKEEKIVFETRLIKKEEGGYKLKFTDCTLGHPDFGDHWTDIEEGEELMAMAARAITQISSLIERQVGKGKKKTDGGRFECGS